MHRKQSLMRFARALATVAILAIISVLAWWHFAPGETDSMFTSRPGVLALGRQVYGRECANCHGAQLEGQPGWRERRPDGRLPAPPHDASGHTWHHSSEVLFGIVKHGLAAFAPAGYETDMPAYAARLSDAQIWAVLAWIRSTWPDEVRRRHDEIERRNLRP